MKLAIKEELHDLLTKRGEKENLQLLEMLSAVEEENTKLKKENIKLEKVVKELKDSIEKKDQEIGDLKLHWNDAGDLAEYTMKINKVMEAAQKAAAEYVTTNKKIEEKAKQEADQIIQEAQEQKERMIKNALREASRIQRLSVITITQIQEEVKQLLDSPPTKENTTEQERYLKSS